VERILATNRRTAATHWVLSVLGEMCLAAGDWDEAARCLDEAIALTEHSGDLQGLRYASGIRAELEVLQGTPGTARARLEPLRDRPGLEEFDVTAFLPVLAWAYLVLGDVIAADEAAGEALRRTRPEQMRRLLVGALRVQALIRLRQGRLSDAEEALQEGLQVARAMPYPYAEARLLQVYGQMHAKRGAPDQARNQLAAALAIFRRLDARKDIERTEQLLTALC
jgi:tetratricopeptide (TPR) repeat protein